MLLCLQDELSQSQVLCHTLQQDLRNQKELVSCQTLEFNRKVSEIQSQREAEVSRLKDALSQVGVLFKPWLGEITTVP